MSTLWCILIGVCSGVFLLGVYAAQTAGRRTEAQSSRITILLVLAAAMAVRLVLAAMTQGHPTDINCFSCWAGHAAVDLGSFYSGDYFADYPPGYIYILWLVGKTQLLLGVQYPSPEFMVLLKLPAILADVAVAWLLYGLARRSGWTAPAALAALYAFNPAVILDSAAWGQVDAVLILPLVAGVILLEKRPAASGAVFALALLIKPQALILVPLPLLWLGVRLLRARNRPALRDAAVFFAAGLAVFILGVLPFTLSYGPAWAVGKYTGTLASYPYASLNAFNLLALVGGNGVETGEHLWFLPYKTWAVILVGLALAMAAVVAWRAQDSSFIWYVPVLLVAAVFVLSTKMHERYLLPVLPLALALFAITRDRWALWLFAGFSVTQLFNIADVLALSYQNCYYVPPDSPLLIAISAANVLLLAMTITIGVRRYVLH